MHINCSIMEQRKGPFVFVVDRVFKKNGLVVMSLLFDIISPLYGTVYRIQTRHYKKVLDKMSSHIMLPNYEKVLDYGCGTGALAYALSQRGHKVTGIDASVGMLRVAKRKTRKANRAIDLLKVERDERLPFADKSFDLVISSFVIHALKPGQRQWVYKELRRVSKGLIIFHDYNEKRGIISDVVEFIEAGDYFNFIKVAKEEMEAFFGQVEIVDIKKQTAWYIIRL